MVIRSDAAIRIWHADDGPPFSLYAHVQVHIDKVNTGNRVLRILDKCRGTSQDNLSGSRPLHTLLDGQSSSNASFEKLPLLSIFRYKQINVFVECEKYFSNYHRTEGNGMAVR